MDENTALTIDLARGLLSIDDLELTSRNLLACLFAVSVMKGTPPRDTLDRMIAYLDEDAWYGEIQPAILDGMDLDISYNED